MKRLRRDWARLVEDQQNSLEGVKEFCESRGIHPNTFYRKRKQHQPLVEIPITGSMEVRPIVLRVGVYELSVQRGFDRECLKAVLEVVGELR